MFGAALVARIKAGEVVPAGDLPMPHIVSLRLRDKPRYDVLESMNAAVLSVDKGVVAIQLSSRDGRLTTFVWLNFGEERFHFDGINRVQFNDDGSPEAARSLLQWAEFYRPYFCNGTVELWSPATDARLARSQPCLPVNMRFSVERHTAWLEELRARAIPRFPIHRQESDTRTQASRTLAQRASSRRKRNDSSCAQLDLPGGRHQSLEARSDRGPDPGNL